MGRAEATVKRADDAPSPFQTRFFRNTVGFCNDSEEMTTQHTDDQSLDAYYYYF